MYNKIKLLAQQYHQETIQTRRDFHKYAERGWLEMRTASLVARRLARKLCVKSSGWDYQVNAY